MFCTPAHAFPPGEYLRDELEARGWTVTEFSAIIGLAHPERVGDPHAHEEITPKTAMAISAALGTTPDVWLNLQARYRLYLATRGD